MAKVRSSVRHMACDSHDEGIDKFVRGGGWDVVKCVFANIWIFSPQIQCTAILLDRINLKDWEGLQPP